VPAYFTEKRRRATQQAGEIAGLTVIGTLNEPMAAALAYGLHREAKEQIALIYDLGGGTFDVTIVRITPNELEELAICGNRQLGGKDWDQCLIDLVLADFTKKHRQDPRQTPDALQILQDLQLACERAKRDLSRRAKTAIRLHALGREHTVEVTREQFEAATAHLLQATRLTTEMALEDAGLRWDQVARVVLVGGSTHMPMVRQMLRDASGFPPDTGINPVTAVALGAALYAHIVETGHGLKAIRTRGAAPPQPTVHVAAAATPTTRTADVPAVRFVTAHGVGIKALQHGTRTNVVLIPKNTRVPITASRKFFTQKRRGHRASKIKIEVTQGDTDNPELAEVLGTATISGIPPNEPSGQPVTITMEFDGQGRLHLYAVYVNTGQNLRLSLAIPGGLREEDVRHYREQMVKTGLITAPAPGGDWDYPLAEEDDDEDDLPLAEPLA
jgi:molecular chaperone DnaK